MKDVLNRLYSFIVSDGQWWRALANLSAAIAVVGFLYAIYGGIREYLTPIVIEMALASITFLLSFSSIVYVYSRVRGQITHKLFPSDSKSVSHRKRILYAIRISYLDHGYFMAIIWLKATRAFLMVATALVLFALYGMSAHGHVNSIDIFGITIYTHNILDFSVIFSIVALAVSTMLNAYETHAIAAGVGRLRIGSYLKSRRRP